MKKLLLLFILFSCISLTSLCQSIKQEDELLNLSKKKFTWMINKNLDSLASILDERIKYVHSNGWMQSKQETIDDLKNGTLVMQSVDVTEAAVRMYGRTAIVNGKGKFTGLMSEKPFSLELMYTEVYVHDGKKWKLVSRHANKLQ